MSKSSSVQSGYTLPACCYSSENSCRAKKKNISPRDIVASPTAYYLQGDTSDSGVSKSSWGTSSDLWPVEGGGGGGGGGGSGSISALLDGIKKPEIPAATGDSDADERALLKYQEQIQAYNRMITMLTNLMQVLHDTRKAIIQNFRV